MPSYLNGQTNVTDNTKEGKDKGPIVYWSKGSRGFLKVGTHGSPSTYPPKALRALFFCQKHTVLGMLYSTVSEKKMTRTSLRQNTKNERLCTVYKA